MSEPVCYRCRRKASEIKEYQDLAAEEGEEVTNWQNFMRHEEGTYNPATNTFACTECYIEAGMPSAPGAGWKAPGL